MVGDIAVNGGDIGRGVDGARETGREERKRRRERILGRRSIREGTIHR